MKPHRIVTLEGIFTLDSTGFYVPMPEPEPKVSGLWLMAMGIVTFAVFGLFVGAYFIAEAVAG